MLMFRFFFRKLNYLTGLLKTKKHPKHENSGKTEGTDDLKFHRSLNRNLALIKSTLGESSDLILREFSFGSEPRINAVLIFIDGLVDKTLINESILQPLLYDTRLVGVDKEFSISGMKAITRRMLAAGEVELTDKPDEAIAHILAGDSLLMADTNSQALIINSRGWKTRSIEDPETESVVRGPREGFTETLLTNTAMMRRKLKEPGLRIESFIIGKRTRTDVALVYLQEIVKPGLVEEIRQRLRRIDTDAILESGYIEEYIEDHPFSPFATIANSEKPDAVAAKILEGRAAILIDGTPFVLTVPMLFIESFQSAEDYYSRPYYASLVRILRFLSFFISIMAPAVYVALTTFHQELLPTPLLITMAAAHEGVPFPSVVEATGMIIIFEILREAGIRLPRPVGQAISIVGALVIGEAAVSAGLVGAPMVIVVALMAISSFVIPAQIDAGTIMRLVLTVLAGFLGALGISIGLLFFLIHLCSLSSFGYPYLSPLAPFSPSGLKDVFVRVPFWAMLKRPYGLSRYNGLRQKPGLMPSKPSNKK